MTLVMELPSSLSLKPIPFSAFPLAAAEAEADADQQAPSVSLPTHLLDLALDKLAAFPESSAGWKRLPDQPGAKGGSARVESFSTGDGWAGRRSVHAADELSWQQVVDHVYNNHYETEQRFVPAFKAFLPLPPSPLAPFAVPTRLASLSLSFRSGLYKLHYVLPFPLQKRTFVVGLVQTLDESLGEVWNVTVPIEHPDVCEKQDGERRRVRGAYASVERLRRVEDDRVEWSMITLSHPGGIVPFSVAKKHVPAEIAKDVSGLIELLRKDQAEGRS